MKCPCNTECTDCVPGFQKIIDLKNAGLIIYRRTIETKDVNINTGDVDYAVNTSEDIYILHNTKDTDISSTDYWPEIGNNTINCPRCRKLLEHAQNLLKKGPTISGNDVTGICDHCKIKDKPCFKCRQVVKRFDPGKRDRTDINKERVKHWLTKIGHLLQDINKITDEKKRAHSDTHIDQICHDGQRSARKPDVEQLVQPLELDLAAISQPHIKSRINGQNKEKTPVAHFPQLEKLETPIVFTDPLKRGEPPTFGLFKHDETFGERNNFNVRRILKPERKILASKYIASTAQIESSETDKDVESVVSFEQIFKDTISGSFTQQGAKTSRHITQSDERISFKLPETKPRLVISEKNEEKPTSRKKTRSVQPLEEKKENLLDTKTKESEQTELLRKYHSAETLVIKIHGTAEYNLKQANRIIFPRRQSSIPTKQKSSSELIKDTKDKLTRDEEEKKLKKKKYESEKAIDRLDSAVDDKQNARQEDKHSVKSDEKADFRAEDEVHKTRKDSQKSPKDTTDVIEGMTEKSEKDTQTAFEKNKSEERAQKTTKAETDDFTSEKGKKNFTKDAPQATTYGFTYGKGAKKHTEDAQKVKDEDIYEKEAQKATKEALKALKGGYKSEKEVQKTAADTQKTQKDGYKSEKGTKEYTKDAQAAEKVAHKFEKGSQTTSKDAQKAVYAFEKGAKKSTKDAQIAEKDGYKFEKGAKKLTKDARYGVKDAVENDKDAQNTSRRTQKAGRSGYTPEKGAKEPAKDAQIAVKNINKFEKGSQKTPTDVQQAKIKTDLSSEKEEKHAQKPEFRGQKTTKDFLKSLRDAEKDMTPKSPKSAQKLQNKDQNTEKHAKKIAMDVADLGFENQLGLKLKQKETSEKKTKAELPSSELKKMKDHEPKLKAEKEKVEIIKKKNEDDQNTEIHAKKISMKAADLGFEKQLGINVKQKALEKKNQSALPTKESKRMMDEEHKLKAEKDKIEAYQKKLEGEIKLDARLAIKPILHDLFNMNSIKIKQSGADDLILKLVQIKQSTWDGDRIRDTEPIKDFRLPETESKFHNQRLMMYPPQSETSLLWTDGSEIDEVKEPQTSDVIIGPQICKITSLKLHDDSEIMPPILKSGYDSIRIDKKQEIAQTSEIPETEESIKPPENEKQETVVSTETPKTKEARKPRPLSPGNLAAGTTSKGYVRYTLSDRKFIDNGWTMLPTEKVVRKMNVYRMRPAHPEFDWFEHNKNKRLMEYDTGEKLAEFDDNGRGRWFYRNGRMALDYYDAEELNAGQRFVIYSNGEPDERGRSRPYTLLATFDFLGNGIVFDHRGKIRLKYNQTEGVVLDRSIGPVSHWKWHTLNDPPVLQQVMIDTQIAHKDPKIMKMGSASDNKPRQDNDEMLAIEFDNFIKEKSKKLSQAFKPFQIKMKALKINEHFSLRVLDQATVYLLYRDGTTNLKLNIGMVLDQKEIVDTDTAEVGEVSSSMEKLPARTESLAGLQRSVTHAQHYDWKRTERERKMHPTEPSGSVDNLVAGISRPLRPPPRPVLSQSTSATTTECKCSRKPTSTSVYYDTRFF